MTFGSVQPAKNAIATAMPVNVELFSMLAAIRRVMALATVKG
eukprot:CAMPEP_0170199014 /NCGR_PEP_ID=MMETSP0040_2-20121228/69104_1 /TAXON_ID=641309 /ORGANISM="Lotharella oceanica, Strain CCMP622" /LENGTH=41 /DNA_ID= /DNA_START= /DNA_END= /DNA_ORIENTATION=